MTDDLDCKCTDCGRERVNPRAMRDATADDIQRVLDLCADVEIKRVRDAAADERANGGNHDR